MDPKIPGACLKLEQSMRYLTVLHQSLNTFSIQCVDGHAFMGILPLQSHCWLVSMGMLRTVCRCGHFLAEASGHRVLLSLGLTKGGKRMGAAESVVLAHDILLPPLLRWMNRAKSGDPLTVSPAKWRKLFNDALEALKVTSFGFRPLEEAGPRGGSPSTTLSIAF